MYIMYVYHIYIYTTSATARPSGIGAKIYGPHLGAFVLVLDHVHKDGQQQGNLQAEVPGRSICG